MATAAKKAASEAAAAAGLCCCLLLLIMASSPFEATIWCPGSRARFGTTTDADLDATAWRDDWSLRREEEETEKGIAEGGRETRAKEEEEARRRGDRKRELKVFVHFFSFGKESSFSCRYRSRDGS